MLKVEVVAPAQTEWASPVLFVPKKDGTLRFCVDCWKLNSVTVTGSHRFPRKDKRIDSLEDAEVF